MIGKENFKQPSKSPCHLMIIGDWAHTYAHTHIHTDMHTHKYTQGMADNLTTDKLASTGIRSPC